ncbi:MAG: hypothetical protein AABW84_01145 [Nanoarchaeota archaeon]
MTVTKPKLIWFDDSVQEGVSKQGDSYIFATNNYNSFKQCLENLVSGETQEIMREIAEGIATDSDNEYTMQFTGLDALVFAEQISPDAENIIKTAERNLTSPVVSESYYDRNYERTKKYLSNLLDSELYLDLFERGGNLFGPVYIQTFLKEKLEEMAETAQSQNATYKSAAKSMEALLHLSMAHFNPEKGKIFNYKNAQDFLLAKKVQLIVTPDTAKGILNRIERARKEFEIKYDTNPTGLEFNTNGQGHVFDKVRESYQKIGFELEASPEVCKTILQCYDANSQNYLQ